ncbi:Transmembrane protein 19 [Lobulomyces angularis]|nr:Transmembrane protein 19 [Lobulomyces angularis]
MMIFPLCLCTFIAIYSKKKKSLSISDPPNVILKIGLFTFSHPYPVFTVTLLTFFILGSKITKFNSSNLHFNELNFNLQISEKKEKLEDNHKTGEGERNFFQVFSNGFTGMVICVLHHYFLILNRKDDKLCFTYSTLNNDSRLSKILILTYISHYACCLGDTFASEIGILSKNDPYLITSFSRVPKGTNGGISLLGTGASALGGLLIGLAAVPFMYFNLFTQYHSKISCQNESITYTALVLCLTGSFSGFIGSIIDSILGATFQASYFNIKKNVVLSDDSLLRSNNEKLDIRLISGLKVLTNNQVNFFSSMITAMITFSVSSVIF